MSAELKMFEGRTVDGRYVLREWLGEGGFGAVFRSEQQVLGVPIRRVAVKLSHRAGMTEETARGLFADALLLAEAMDGMTDTEARAHLVHLYDAGVAADIGGRGYLAMEYVQGPTLADQFASYPRGVPARLLMNWARQICVALRGLHTLVPPLLHRDLKPDNVLLGLDHTVRLVDFGLAAKLVEVGHVEGVAGTLAYMAPETAQGESTPASDLYSLGLLIYEGLTRRHPFGHLHPPADLPKPLHRHWLYDARRACRVEPPSLRNNTVPPEIDALVLRCLAHSPGRRFSTAEEVLAAMDEPPTPPRPERTAVQEARRLRSEHDLNGACSVLEQALAGDPGSTADRFALLRELAEVRSELGDHEEAARRYEQAWRLVERAPALLRTREERADLACRVSEAYRQAGNAFQANRYAELSRREGGTGCR